MISRLLSGFASESGPHIAIAPEHVFTVGGIAITNSQVYAVICAGFIAALFIWAARKMTVKAARGPVQFIEMGIDFIISLLESNIGDRQKAVKYAPTFAAIFFFILLNNWLGLMPGVGPGIFVNTAEGEVPLLRPFTADLNGTIALALFGIATVQIIAIKEQGGMNHLRHYFGGNFKNPINIFVGILEMFGEVTRVVSLSLRLFFNVLIGEILISIFTYLGKGASFITTLPFIGMELFVGLVQAYIFTMLCATYLGIAVAHHDDSHSEAHDPHETDSPVLAGAESGSHG